MADRELEREQEEESGAELRVFIGPRVERHQQPVGHDAFSKFEGTNTTTKIQPKLQLSHPLSPDMVIH
jgi:hypothetical protein